FRNGVDSVPEGVPEEQVQLAIVAGDWVLLDPEGGELWREGVADPIPVDVSPSARLQASSGEASGSDVLIADESGLVRVTEAGQAERIAEADGVPTQPIAVGAERYTAWLSSSAGALWSSSGDVQSLDLDDEVTASGD